MSANGRTSDVCYRPHKLCKPKAYEPRMATRGRTRAHDQLHHLVTVANQDATASVILRRPKAASTNCSERQVFTRMTLHSSRSRKVLMLQYTFLVLLIRLWPMCHFDLGGIETWLGVVRRTDR